jgi:hypothetical protein
MKRVLVEAGVEVGVGVQRLVNASAKDLGCGTLERRYPIRYSTEIEMDPVARRAEVEQPIL